MSLRLRPATLSDGAALLRWRNDPRVYRHYFHPRPVPRPEHEAWLSRTLAGKRCRLFIIESGGKACGQVRLDISRGAAEISVAVDPRAQGRGLGAKALAAAALRSRRLGVRKLTALTLPQNVGSAVAFLRAGFRFTGLTRRGGRAAYRLEKSS